ncbi:GDSL esterase/lipase EXL3 isoform X2 [Beta vulgaris subsp. vulgaris]|uniref:GDSL esterase/lipase EXL3 isoform X2 n=1 Tax=Beta vulgaris subsp. vulgaris TaxID=3555 RepID=UPI002036C4C1|nr:GDSL esterase/lipase EXL3 isoform X2 [Beta vulgaris subsp. vulgaris]
MKKRSKMKCFLGNESISYSKLINIVVYYIVMASYLHIHGHAKINPEEKQVPALIVFGDSIVDPGNNNYLATIGKANFLPYGRDFPGGIPTGRYSNGKVPSDFFDLQISDLLTGVSFASGVSGYDPSSAKLENVLSLEDQLKLFKGYINKLETTVGENTTSTIISQSLYLVCTGSNDITNSFFGSPITRLQYDISTYTDLMVNWASSFVQELYALGARRIGVINAPPCGCLPSQRLLHGGLLRACAEEENKASILFNNKLSFQLASLNQKLAKSRIVYLDIYKPFLNLINNPSQSGFEVVDRGCCGTGNIEVSVLCTKLDPGTCQDASKYIFWDSFHPTETTYRLIVHEVLQKSLGDFF